jgi:hypothetical protein
VVVSSPVAADTFVFNTGDANNLMAAATRPESPGKFEIETGDDFVLTQPTLITGAAFTGLIPSGAATDIIKNVVVEIYRVFPADSDVGRTSGPPTFSTANVPTRVNSPSDNALDERKFSEGSLSFIPVVQQPTFTANNSVKPDGIKHPPPNFTGGNGPVTGQEVQINVSFTTPFNLPADHYFFVPQVELSNGDFFWLSAARPIVPPGTTFPPGFTDLQSWTRDGGIEPDWLRIGTDITGQGPFNAAFAQWRDRSRSNRWRGTAGPNSGVRYSSRPGATPSKARRDGELFFYISRMYEFLHRLGQKQTSRRP